MRTATTIDRRIEQADRLLVLQTPLPPDELIPVRFAGSEEISRLFSYRLGVITNREKPLEASELLGKGITVLVKRHSGETDPSASRRPKTPEDRERDAALGKRRAFHGIVKSLSPGSVWERGYRHYEIELVPWLWFLTRSADIRIFQKQNTKEIVEQVLRGVRKSTGDVKDSGFKREFDLLGIKGTYQTRDFCVQYRESDFDFVSRLLEEEGIYYYFKHEPGSHKMILADKKDGYYDCDDAMVEFRANRDITRHVSEWLPRYETRTGKWRLKDYDFEKPSTDLTATTNTRLKVPAFQPYEVYDYPGRYIQKSDGDNLAVARMEAHEAEHHVVDSAGDCMTFSPGARFELVRHKTEQERLHDLGGEKGFGYEYEYEHLLEKEFGKYVVTSVQHSAIDPTHVTGEGGPPTYENRFTCIPAEVLFRPASITPKPVVRGPQTAVVVGPKDEEIYTDKYGRIKVQFHWDREGKKNEDSSFWVRVAQSWAGRQWGSIYIPRVGMEVVVDFLEGDPDHPIVTGCVYNAENMPPYGLPGNRTQSGLKTRSSLKGGPEDFNELRFEDKKGAEQIYFHAQKNFDRKVEHDDTLDVGNHQTIKIKMNRTEEITQGSETVDIKMGNRDHTLGMGNDSLTLKMGNRATKFTLGKDETEAMQSIEFKVGMSSIKIDQMGVTIKGMMIKLDGTIMTEVKSGVMLQLKGPITMIN